MDRVLFRTYLGLNADCCEFCPDVHHLLATGCYQLNKETQARDGLIYLFKIHEEKNYQLEELQRLKVPGVFDMKWGGSKLAVANAAGMVEVYRLLENQSLDLVASSLEPKSTKMSLSVAWNYDRQKISTSFSSGAVEVFSLEGSRGLIPTWKSKKAHDNEVEAVVSTQSTGGK
eukprot:TRINITY_DN8806_c0_g1_i7.p1 TRINITY_DN8806_c0_g1~~TRINITY_DN8806_c0_g1_i7.p1  ORF type:complete len:173 (-),score=38.26 TRINITY_DN8806_c0_g1_i7:118-636(-)